MTGDDVLSGAAWRSFCDRMAALGDRILAESGSDDVKAEGVHHLANQVACWLTYAIGHTDPAHPAFFRSSDPVYQWGGPNADQVARRAAIEGSGTYRISGRMGTCEEFVLQIKEGTTQSGGAGVAMEVSASSLGIGPGDDFEIVLSADERPGTWLGLPPEAAFVHVRDYYFDWQAAEGATFVIERLDTQGDPRAGRTPDRVAAVLDEAAHEIEHSIAFWSGYQDRMLQGRAVNELGPPAPAARGVQEILYSHGRVSLDDGDALVVELDPGDAPLWDVQLYNRPWYEALDFANRVTSRNHRLVTADDDGMVRLVIANRDPGAPNWIDTEGRAEVLATIRWWRPVGVPYLRTEVVPLELLAPTVDPEGRRHEIRGRAAHVAWRYRS